MRAMFVAVVASQWMEPTAPAALHVTVFATPNAVAVPATRQSVAAIAEAAVWAFQHIQLVARMPVYATASPARRYCTLPPVIVAVNLRRRLVDAAGKGAREKKDDAREREER